MFEIKFSTCIKIGAGIYLGYAGLKTLDTEISKRIRKTKFYENMMNEINSKNEEQEIKMGFQV